MVKLIKDIMVTICVFGIIMSRNYLENKNVNHILTEIAFMGISYNMLNEVSPIIKLFKFNNQNKEHTIIVEVMFLISSLMLNEALDLINKSLDCSDITDKDMLKVFKIMILKLQNKDFEISKQLNHMLSSQELQNNIAINFAKNLLIL